MIILKKSRTIIKIASLDRSNLFIRHNHVHEQENYLYMITRHVVRIDILTGHEEIGNLHFILKIIFQCIFIKKPGIFSKLVQFILKI